MKSLYRGYSSFEFEKNKTFVLVDQQLVDMDLLNNIYTRKGSRVMMPNYGTLIPEMTFEPLDDSTVETVESELMTVINNDPRVSLINLTVVSNFDTNSIFATAILNYIELNMTAKFELNIVFESA